MTVPTKEFLSGGANGQQVLIAAVTTPGTTIHTTGATAKDEVWLWAHNTHTAPLVLTIEWGGVTDPSDIMSISIPIDDGWTLIVPGFIISNSSTIAGFTATTNVVVVQGYVNRLT